VIDSKIKPEIGDLAEFIAEEYCPESPVNPIKIAEEKGITHSFGDYGEAFDGMLEHKNGRFHIFANAARSHDIDAPRARFTISHELGHFFIDGHRNALSSGQAPSHLSRSEYKSDNLVEKEADFFASNLLMPKDRFQKAAKKKNPGLAGILILKETFKTSVESTAIRYAVLDIKPCIVIKWDESGRAWSWYSREAWNAKIWGTIVALDKILSDSATGKARTEELPEGTKFFDGISTVSTWFPKIPCGSAKDIILTEHAMKLGRFGIITFLFPKDGSFGPTF